ncbi:MAG: hypothetical protein L6Q37_04050 [Bdellovibrionaceae bacterium]|nr:hypothetical protein [Pseudobdellovibrionaceae bacterium]NUM58780.1 hypothetical protein [Pseudobdellovibrionaceae bacterium]
MEKKWKNRLCVLIKNLILSLLLISSIDLLAVELSPAGKMLESDILSAKMGFYALTKTTRLYHYFNPVLTGSKTGQAELWPTYQTIYDRYRPEGQIALDFAVKAGAFWDINIHDTKLVNAGPGMYLATDPLVSQNFGSSLYVIDFPIGSRVLDVSDPTWTNVSKIKLKTETLLALQSEGILNRKQIQKLGMNKGYFVRLSLQYMADYGLEKYRQLLAEIFDRHQIVLIQFSWEKNRMTWFCKSKTATDAFVYVGGRPDLPVTNTYVMSKVSRKIIDNSVFTSSYSVKEQSSKEKKIIELTDSFKKTLSEMNKDLLTSEQVQSLQQLSFGCL